MLFLLSIALVIAALVLLVLGLIIDQGLGLIYTSIGASVVAAIVLFVSVRLDRDRPPALADGPSPRAGEVAVVGGTPEPTSSMAAVMAPPAEPSAEPAQEPASTGTDEPPSAETSAEPAPTEAVASADDQWAPPPAAEAVPSASAAADEPWKVPEGGWKQSEEEFFPIADYDELTVQEILPLLPQLYPEEIPVVAERERGTKARAVILDTLADLQSELPESAAVGQDGPGAPQTATDDLGGFGESPAVHADVAAPEGAATPEDAATPEATAVSEAAVGAAEAEAADPAAASAAFDDLPFPIEDYDSLTAPAIVAVLPELEPDELAEVRAYEAGHANRTTVLTAIDRVPDAPPPAAAAAKKVRARSTPAEAGERPPAKRSSRSSSAATKGGTAKKSSATKKKSTTATKSGAAKKSSATKKSAAKKSSAGTKSSAAKKSTTATKSSATKKSATKKSAAKKSSAGTKSSAAKKSTTKKSTGSSAKRAAKAPTAAKRTTPRKSGGSGR